MKNIFTYAAALLTSASFALAHGGWDLSHEHKGDVFRHAHAPGCCVNGVMHNGNSTGEMKVIDGETLYIAYPPHQRSKCTTAILYLTDIFGIQLVNNRLLADSLAHAGYLVVMPDLFRGDSVPADALDDPTSTFNLTAWFPRHPATEIDSIVTSTLNTMQSHFGVSRIGSVGYCFGGRYVARFLSNSSTSNSSVPIISAGFAAHPSNTLPSEWEAVAHPVSIAFGALDDSNTPENRTNIEEIFQSGNKTYQTALYANAEHGFAVRTDLSVKSKAFAQESAYFQAVRWLDAWVKGDED